MGKTPFKLKSGNRTAFKMMGSSSPAKRAEVHEVPTYDPITGEPTKGIYEGTVELGTETLVGEGEEVREKSLQKQKTAATEQLAHQVLEEREKGVFKPHTREPLVTSEEAAASVAEEQELKKARTTTILTDKGTKDASSHINKTYEDMRENALLIKDQGKRMKALQSAKDYRFSKQKELEKTGRITT